MAESNSIELRLQDKNMTVMRDSAHLLYAKAMDYFCRLHFDDGTVLDYPYSLKSLQELLAPSRAFMRVHKSYLVRKNLFTACKRYMARLSTGQLLPLGRKGYIWVCKYLQKLGKRLR